MKSKDITRAEASSALENAVDFINENSDGADEESTRISQELIQKLYAIKRRVQRWKK